MPINHWLSPYMMEASAKTPIPTTAAAAASFWATPAAVFCGQSQSATFRLNLNNEDEEELPEEPAATAMDDGESENPNFLPKEPLFEKPLTPSDVGKLNRLVIPKQHAEKYFPLNGSGGGDSGGGEKGLLLGFEDEAGKSWRFRYSYWNSSQSYVLTKGWSRFVKEKRLDAGDIVLFARHPKDVGRLFIGWRRRNGGGGHESAVPPPPCGGGDRGGGGWSGLIYTTHPYPAQSSNSVLYQTDCPHADNHIKEKNGNSKRLRLFGVNLEWDDDESEPTTSGSGKASSQGPVHEDPYHEYYSSHRRTGHTVSYVCDSTNI